LKLAGDIFNSPKITTEKVEVAKLLAPIQPGSIICIGLNYCKNAEETGATLLKYPVVFFKGINTLRHPGARSTDSTLEIPARPDAAVKE
jgi:2-keto-4-pentenoate hydratase/2-oxohepta-3-ene-1,7-dioic acid hydratase in catechol pathway